VEKDWGTMQAYFTYFDGEWANILLDTEESQSEGYSQVFNDPQNDMIGGQIQNNFPGDTIPDPTPTAALEDITLLRNCKDVVLRLDPSTTEARGARMGVEFEIAQALSRFKLAAIALTVSETTPVGGR
jgi:hypothetical protein